ncbi:hypothetical protein TH25_22795 [Thalassospira profundimaris]|uniref:Tripartite tricarboxylate transporter TctB n=1 Tax=Thalassospira profundimaris TaxID=502049 RepID=A0A367WLV7_9PROT|nr:hypothetical protein [Thalassospira profundimaris]RCK42446.1 hypothetical protein TH25_22795 [Thalassospira profundimaris]
MNTDVMLGLGVVLLALLAIFIWVPDDTATGLIVKLRGRVSIGDALAPTAAFVLMVVAGVLIAFEGHGKDDVPHLSLANLRFVGLFAALFLVSVILMRWTGPALVGLVHLLGSTDASYRDLRDTVPWKYAGFVTGGTFLVTMLMSLIERRLSWRALLVGLAVTALLILIFDVPFSDLLLPPNGDV